MIKSIIGQQFGRLTVIDEKKGGKVVCLCVCGNIKECHKSTVVHGKTTSCGCAQKEAVSKANTKDLTGQKFGALTVIKQVENRVLKSGVSITQWLCKCECGNEKIVRPECLRQGGTRSCGCLKSRVSSERFSSKLEGQRFGKLLVLERAGSFIGSDGAKYSQWLCRCDCGTFKTVRGHDLVRGSVTSCGCSISRGEEEVRLILNSNKVTFDTQYKFDDLRSEKGRMLQFDFAVLGNSKELLCLIEYNGIQHYVEQPMGFGQQQREVTDSQKRQYCTDHEIPFFVISYLDNIEESIIKIINQLNIPYANTVPSLIAN